MFTVKLFELKNAESTLAKIFTTATFSLKRSYELLKFEETFKKENETFEKIRTDAIKKYGEISNPETGEYQISQENMPKFYQELNELLAVDVNVNFKKFTIDELENSGIKLTVSELKFIQPFLQDEVELESEAVIN